MDNFNVNLNIKKNSEGGIEVNNYTQRALLNNNFFGLSFYELSCQPREIYDTEKVSIDNKKIERIIKEILRCNICLQIYEDPVNIKSCLHKFCKRCIEDYNRKVKKECALCRHPIETRRLLREDGKIKEIIKCLIPNIKKFNDVEENFIKDHLTDLCFKDSARKIHQEEASTKILQNAPPESVQVNNNIIIPNNSNNLNYGNKIESNDKDYLQRKKNRNGKQNTNETNKRTVEPNPKKVEQAPNGESDSPHVNTVTTVGIKLICESDNDDLRKYFAKTKLYTNDDISLDYFSKYICFKQNFPQSYKEKIAFFVLDDNKRVELDKKQNLREIKKNHKLTEDIIKLYFTLNV